MRIALCSQELLFLEALSALLDRQGRYQVVNTETSLRRVISGAKDSHAHAILVDSRGLDDTDIQFLLGARAFGDLTVVMIANKDDSDRFREGVDRVVGHDEPAEALFAALNDLGANIRPFRGYVRERRRGYSGNNQLDLSRREYEVAQLVGKGLSNRKIAQATGLREQSVKNLVSVIMRKLRCENRVQVALKLTSQPVGGVEAEA